MALVAWRTAAYFCEWCGEDKNPQHPDGHEACLEALGYEFPERPVLTLVIPDAS